MEDFKERLGACFGRSFLNLEEKNLLPSISVKDYADNKPPEEWLREPVAQPTGKKFVLMTVTYSDQYRQKYCPQPDLGGHPIVLACTTVLSALGLKCKLHNIQADEQSFKLFLEQEEEVYRRLPPVEELSR